MPIVLGYALAFAGLYTLYLNYFILGAGLVFIGGRLSRNLYFSASSLGTMMVLLGLVYGYHNQFTLGVVLVIVAGLLLTGVFNSNGGWELNWDIGDITDSGGGADGGGDCGGGDGGGGE